MTNQDKIEQFAKYRCRLSFRPEYAGNSVKPECADHNGKEVTLSAGWLMDDDDKYPGEWAMTYVKFDDPLLKEMDIGWIASGDIEVIERV